MSQANKPQRGNPFMDKGPHIVPISRMSSANNLEDGLNGTAYFDQGAGAINGPSTGRGATMVKEMNSSDLGLHRTQMKSTTVDRLSKVLLVIFSDNESRTNQDLFDIFSPFVRVSRVLIFDRRDLNMKCFVEMMTLQEATYVKNEFSFQKAKNPQQKGGVQIYYAQIPTINLQNHYSEGHDFSSFYSSNPTYTCQYFKECEQSNQMGGTYYPQQHHQQQVSQQHQQIHTRPTSTFGSTITAPTGPTPYTTQRNSTVGGQIFAKPQFGAPPQISQGGQFLPNQAVSDMDNNTIIDGFGEHHNDPIFEQQSVIRPRSIQSIDYHQLQFGQSSRYSGSNNNVYNAGKVSQLSQFGAGTVFPSRRTVPSNPMSSSDMATASFESKVYAAHMQQGQPQPTQMLDKQKNIQADQFHKDFLMKDGILQNHLSQQFHQHQQSQHPGHKLQQHQQQQQHPQQFRQQSHSPQVLRQYLNDHIETRSPSQTTFSFQQDMMDVDENVMVYHPSAFLTKHRDDLFFNGGSEQMPQKCGGGYEEQVGESLEEKRVLFVRHLDSPELKISMIYNVFSNYGNIVKILFMKQKRQALIEFETTPQACAAKEFLNNVMYYGAQIKLDFSKYDQIDLQRKKLHTGESNDQEQVLSIPVQCFRYKVNKAIPQYTPKPTLHVSNIRKEYFDSNLLYELFASTGARVVMIKLIPNEKKQMCLVQFETLDDALRIISTLHDLPFYGRNLCISFTKNSSGTSQTSALIGQKSSEGISSFGYQQPLSTTAVFLNQSVSQTHPIERHYQNREDLPEADDFDDSDDGIQIDIENQLQNLGI